MPELYERFAVEILRFRSGERFPVLVDRQQSRRPLFEETAYGLFMLRARNKASSTIEVAMRALKVWRLFCELNNLDLKQRMSEGRLLEGGEVEALAVLCRLEMAAIEATFAAKIERANPALMTPLPRYRAQKQAQLVEAGGHVLRVRLYYISEFIQYLAEQHLFQLHAQHPHRAALVDNLNRLLLALKARAPRHKKRNMADTPRLALDEAEQTRLWQIVIADSPENPWGSQHTRVRNELIVRWLMYLGLRRGELLGLSTKDIQFGLGTVKIRRKPDNPNDPRADQPNAKTYSRELPLDPGLIELTRAYIAGMRKVEVGKRFQQSGKRDHLFLFVATGGEPLSKRGLNDIFLALQRKQPGYRKLFPHLFRHTANFNLSLHADATGMSPEEEMGTRTLQMGWSPTSETALQYTKRESQRKANQAMLDIVKSIPKPIIRKDK